MDRRFVAGLVLTVAGVSGYLAGVRFAYPGRAFSVTLVMVGVTLLAIGRRNGDQPGWSA